MFSEAVICLQLPQANTSEKASNHSAMLTLVFICNSTNQTLTAAPPHADIILERRGGSSYTYELSAD